MKAGQRKAEVRAREWRSPLAQAHTLPALCDARQPDLADTFIARANAAAVRSDFATTVRYYKRALERRPRDAELWSNLGCAQTRRGRARDALKSFVRALEIDPDSARANSNLATALEAAGRVDDAIVLYRRAVALDPRYALAHCNLGGALQRANRLDEAIRHYLLALKIDPEMADACSNLGCAMQALGHIETADACFRRALTIRPDHHEALINLGDVWREQGRFNEALGCYRRAIAQRPQEWGVRVKEALTLPVVLESSDQAEQLRARMVSTLEALEREGARLDDPNREVGMANFYLAYQGHNDAPLQARIAQFYLRACPDLAWSAPHCHVPRAPRRRLKVGIVSAHLGDHTVGKLYLGIIQKLSRERFEVIVMRPGRKNEAAAKAIGAAADRDVELSLDLRTARQQIAAEELDILFYPDIGMGSLTYFLGFARLAPVQCVSWGHPVTTGIPNIDYFLSARGLEPAAAQAHYTEQLVELDSLPVYYRRPERDVEPLTREQLGLPAAATLYVCPQSIFKFHPAFDLELAALLRRDPDGHLVLIAGQRPYWSKLLGARIARNCPDIAGRVVFVPRVSQALFPRLLKTADVLLDPPYFGGGNTSFEAFAAGLPIITWPAPFMRGRVTAGCYERMGITELIADSMESYVELAYRVAHDREYRERVCAEIKRRADVLFEDRAAIADLERFFIAAADAAGEGRKIATPGVQP
ncbi:MAG TPA: tetratricopeptide repeat protein [Candidatus Binataceae bacterium]|nr:tetratricopeptide repeat protein [Candidatus Binataceae bacterium]